MKDVVMNRNEDIKRQKNTLNGERSICKQSSWESFG